MEFKKDQFADQEPDQERFPKNSEIKQEQPIEQMEGQINKQVQERSQRVVDENQPTEEQLNPKNSEETKKQTENSVEFRGHKIIIPEEK